MGSGSQYPLEAVLPNRAIIIEIYTHPPALLRSLSMCIWGGGGATVLEGEQGAAEVPFGVETVIHYGELWSESNCRWCWQIRLRRNSTCAWLRCSLPVLLMWGYKTGWVVQIQLGTSHTFNIGLRREIPYNEICYSNKALATFSSGPPAGVGSSSLERTTSLHQHLRNI